MSQEQIHLHTLNQGKISVPANYGSNGDNPKLIYGVEKKPMHAKSPEKTYSVPLSELELFLENYEDTDLRLHQINDDTLGRMNQDGGLLIVRRKFPVDEPYGRAVFSQEELKVIKDYIQEYVTQPVQNQ